MIECIWKVRCQPHLTVVQLDMADIASSILPMPSLKNRTFIDDRVCLCQVGVVGGTEQAHR